MVQRSVPVCGSEPIIASMTPKQAIVTPFNGALPDRTATVDSPKTDSASISGEPKDSISGRNTGMATAISKEPNRPPNIEER
jgi:hypothetical protein